MTALNVADYITTRQALKYPGLSEGNPLMKPFVKNAAVFAAVKAGTTVLSVWGMKSLFKRDRTTAWVLTTVSNLPPLLRRLQQYETRLQNAAKVGARGALSIASGAEPSGLGPFFLPSPIASTRRET